MNAEHKRMAGVYVRTLAGDTQAPMTWQVFDDSGQPVGYKLARILHGSLRECGQELLRMQEQRRGIFAAVNETDLQGRKAANVTRVRALFCDFDGPVPPTWHLPPSMIVQSAHGPHVYWLVDDLHPVAFKEAQQRLAKHYGSDPKVCDLPRVLRVPGFLHLKREPFRVELVAAPGHRYRAAAILDGIAPMPTPEAPTYRPVSAGTARWREMDPLHMFAAAGLYGRQLEAGKHAVLCPWYREHSGTPSAAGSDTVIWERGNSGLPIFMCAHSHCEGRYMAHALREIAAWGGA